MTLWILTLHSRKVIFLVTCAIAVWSIVLPSQKGYWVWINGYKQSENFEVQDLSVVQQCSKKTDPAVFAVLLKKIHDLVVHHSTIHRVYFIHPLYLVVRKEHVQVTDYTPVIQCSYTLHCWCAATTLNAQASDCNIQLVLSSEHVDGTGFTLHVRVWIKLAFLAFYVRTIFALLFKVPSKAESIYGQLLQDRKHFVGIKLRSLFPCNHGFLRWN